MMFSTNHFKQKKKELYEALAQTRIGHEGENLMGQVFGGWIYQTVLHAALDALVIAIVVLAVHFAVIHFFPQIGCALWCNLDAEEVRCCAYDPTVILYLASLFAAALVAKLFCIHGLTTGVFRHSALSDVLLLLVTINILYSRGVSVLVVSGVTILLFLALFCGYRLGLKTTV